MLKNFIYSYNVFWSNPFLFLTLQTSLSPPLFPPNFMCSAFFFFNKLSPLSAVCMYMDIEPSLGASDDWNHNYVKNWCYFPQQWPVANRLGWDFMKSFSICAKILTGLLVYQSYTESHSHCDFMCAVAQPC